MLALPQANRFLPPVLTAEVYMKVIALLAMAAVALTGMALTGMAVLAHAEPTLQ
jgi:hypothetical protein